MAFPAGDTGTQQVVNRSASAARVLICSTNEMPDVAEQIETGLVAIVTPAGLRLFPRRQASGR